MNTSTAAFGDYTRAKLDFLAAARARIDPETGCRGGVGVNRRHCRPLAPHGLRMVRDGLMQMTRDGQRLSRYSALVITDAGLAELARIERRQKRQARRHADT